MYAYSSNITVSTSVKIRNKIYIISGEMLDKQHAVYIEVFVNKLRTEKEAFLY